MFWVVYHLIWLSFNVGASGVVQYLLHGESKAKFFGYIVFHILGAYFNLYVLMPRLLEKGHLRSYIGAVMLTIVFCAAGISGGYYVADFLSDKSFHDLFDRNPEDFMPLFLNAALPSTVGAMTLAMSIKLGKKWFEAERHKTALQQEKLETELKYLKSQTNPHFLFNTINSIFALIHKNPDMASESLASFSQLLRYQLYECNGDLIDLHTEIKYLENFIELEQLRLDESNTSLQFDLIQTGLTGKKIAPLLLIPLVENAFKHVTKGRTQHNFIHMSLKVDDDKLLLDIKNSSTVNGHKSMENKSYSGIGLTNVRRRLALVYPDRHQLITEERDAVFSAQLKLELT